MSDAGEAATGPGAESTPALVPDEQLLQSHELARAALLEITPAATIGDVAGYTVEGEQVLSLRFENRMLGYPGWFWTVTIARVEGAEPTVLETELMPGEGALLAPEWVPWAVRLAEYQTAQAAAAAERAAAGESDEDDESEDSDELDDLDDVDEDDFETDGSAILHSGDLDGVDIDPDDEDEDEDSDDEDDDESDEDEEDSDGSEGDDEDDFIDDSDDPEGIDRSY